MTRTFTVGPYTVRADYSPDGVAHTYRVSRSGLTFLWNGDRAVQLERDTEGLADSRKLGLQFERARAEYLSS